MSVIGKAEMNRVFSDIFISGIVIGGIIIYFLIKKSTKLKKESLIEKQAREKTENKRKILNFIQTREKISN